MSRHVIVSGAWDDLLGRKGTLVCPVHGWMAGCQDCDCERFTWAVPDGPRDRAGKLRVVLTQASGIEPAARGERRTKWGPWHIDRATCVLWTTAGGYRYEVDLEDSSRSSRKRRYNHGTRRSYSQRSHRLRRPSSSSTSSGAA